MTAGENPKARAGSFKPSTLSVVPSSVILAMGSVMAVGAAKYGRFNWRKTGASVSTYLDSTMRHLMAYADGEDVDEETKELHLVNAIAGLAVLVDAHARGVLIDDRDVHEETRGTAAALIAKHAAYKMRAAGVGTISVPAPTIAPGAPYTTKGL